MFNNHRLYGKGNELKLKNTFALLINSTLFQVEAIQL